MARRARALFRRDRGKLEDYMSTSYIVGMRSNNNVTFDCKYHVVWCPKYRRDVLVRGVDVRLKQIVCEVARERGAEVMELEVMPDHVHLVVDVDPQFGIHRLVKLIKGRSSRLLR